MRPFTYTRAASVADAVASVAAGGADTRFLAGGTTLYDLMKLGVEAPAHIVDVNALTELASIETDGDALVLGALARMSDVAEDPVVRRDYPALSESLWRAASQQLRNMASVGGNLLQRTRCAYFRGGPPFPCNKREPGSGCAAHGGLDRGHAVLGGSEACVAVYPGDWAVALVAFDAAVDVVGPGGPRTIAVEALHREPGALPHIETVLTPGDMIAAIRVPKSPVGRGSTYHKIRDRESYAFALAAAAVALEMDGDVVRSARIALGGLATRPWRCRQAETLLIGERLTHDMRRAAGEAALAGAVAGGSNGFRIELGVRTVVDALMIARERAR